MTQTTKTTALAKLKGAVGRLPAPRDRATMDVLRGLRSLVTGQPPSPAGPMPGKPRKREPIPKPEPLPHARRSTFPPIEAKGDVVRSLYKTGSRPPRFDVDLLEQLNAEYAERPIVPAPRKLDPVSMEESARKRIDWAHGFVDLRDTTVLEIGAGRGYTGYVLAHEYGSDVDGVDVVEYTSWAPLSGDRLRFHCADMTVENPFPANTFNRVVSFTVWEHVVHPRKLLRETYKVLKPGGQALIRANLYAGPMASHRYRELFFPWPHLLFSDDVISDWYVKNGGKPRRPSWVNRLSWPQYDAYLAEIGFIQRHLSFSGSPFDQAFYERFEDTLSRFPIDELKRDFFNVVVEKPV